MAERYIIIGNQTSNNTHAQRESRGDGGGLGSRVLGSGEGGHSSRLSGKGEHVHTANTNAVYSTLCMYQCMLACALCMHT